MGSIYKFAVTKSEAFFLLQVCIVHFDEWWTCFQFFCLNGHTDGQRAWLNDQVNRHKLHRFWIIGLHRWRTCMKVQQVLWFHSWVIRFNERCTFWIAYSKLTIFSYSNLVKILVDCKWAKVDHTVKQPNTNLSLLYLGIHH